VTQPPEQPDARPKRPARVWVILLAVWALGLIVWVLYLVAIGYLLSKVL
jgi:hypothetical protein